MPCCGPRRKPSGGDYPPQWGEIRVSVGTGGAIFGRGVTCAQQHPARTQLFWLLAAVVIAVGLPYVSNDYWVSIGTRAAIYWVLISGLNLVVGFAGQLCDVRAHLLAAEGTVHPDTERLGVADGVPE